MKDVLKQGGKLIARSMHGIDRVGALTMKLCNVDMVTFEEHIQIGRQQRCGFFTHRELLCASLLRLKYGIKAEDESGPQNEPSS